MAVTVKGKKGTTISVTQGSQNAASIVVKNTVTQDAYLRYLKDVEAPYLGENFVLIYNSNTNTFQAKVITLGLNTTGDYVENVIQGPGIVITNNRGEGMIPTFALSNTGVSAGTYGNGYPQVAVPVITVDQYGRISHITTQGLSNAELVAANLTVTGNVVANVSITAPFGNFTTNVTTNVVTTQSLFTSNLDTAFLSSDNAYLGNAYANVATIAGNVVAGNLLTSRVEGTAAYFSENVITGNVNALTVSTYDVLSENIITTTISTDNIFTSNIDTETLYATSGTFSANVLTGNVFTDRIQGTSANFSDNVITGNVNALTVSTYDLLSENIVTTAITTDTIFTANIDTESLYATTGTFSANVIAGNVSTDRVEAVSGNYSGNLTSASLHTGPVYATTGAYSGNVNTGNLTTDRIQAQSADFSANLTSANVFVTNTVQAPIGNFTSNLISATLTTGEAYSSNTITGALTTVNINAVDGDFSDNVIAGNIVSRNSIVGQDVHVQGSLYSNDITADLVVVQGNLFVQGTTTTINTEEIALADNKIVLNSNQTGIPVEDAGIVVNRGNQANVEILWDETFNVWKFTNDGNVYYLIPTSTTDLLEGNNLYFTNARAQASLSVNDIGGDGELFYNSANGQFTYRGPSADEVRAHLNAGIGLEYSNATGTFRLANTTVTAGSYGNSILIPIITVDDQGRISNVQTTLVAGVDNFTANGNVFTIFTTSGQTFSASIQPNSIILSRDTVGDYVSNLTAGTGVTVQNNNGEGSNVIVSIGQNVDPTATVTFANVSAHTFDGNVTAEFANITSLVGVTIALTGDITANSFLTNVIETTVITSNNIFANSITLTDYVSAANATFTGSVDANVINNLGNLQQYGVANFYSNAYFNSDVIINGNLSVLGNVTTLNVQDLVIDDPLVYMGANNLIDDNVDLGFVVHYTDSANVGRHGGFFRDATDKKFKLFDNTYHEIGVVIDTSSNVFRYANLVLGGLEGVTGDFTENVSANYFIGNVIGTVSSLENHTTSNLAEGNNLYFTNARALTAVENTLTTTSVIEGTNLYFTNARAVAALQNTDPVFNNVTVAGVLYSNDITADNVVIQGNLLVTGTTTSIKTVDLYVDDNKVTLNANVTGAPLLDAGLVINRGTSANVELLWDENTDTWKFTNDGNVYYLLPTTTSDLIEGANLYFTVQRSRDSISPGVGLNYDNTTGIVRLANTTVVANTYGNSILIPIITVDDQGRITDVQTTLVAGVSTFTTNANTLTIITTAGSTFQANLDPDLIVSATPPVPAYQGLTWLDSNSGKVFEYFGDGDSFQWVELISDGVIPISSSVQTVNGLTGNVVLTTTNVNEGTNLYFTNTRSIGALTAGAGIDIAANGLITSSGGGGAVSSVNGLTGVVTLVSANIAENTNLYFSNARVYSNVALLGFATNAQITGFITNAQLTGYATNAQLASYATNADLSLYATNAQLASYATNAQLSLYATNAQLSLYALDTDLTTANVAEVSNLYYTDDRVYTNVILLNYATTSYVGNAVANLVNSAPAALDTLNELAQALGNDNNFSTTVVTLIGSAYNQANSAFAAANTKVIAADLTTANVVEVTNLYFTNARAIAAVNDNINTSNVAEGANLYYTDARVYSNVQSIGYASNTYVNTELSTKASTGKAIAMAIVFG